MNSSNLGSSIERPWVLSIKLGTKLKVHDLQPSECLTQYKRPCNSLTLLAEARAKRSQVFQIRCLSEDNFTGLYGGQERLFKIRDRFHSGGLISLGRQDFLKLLNISLFILLAVRPVPAMVKTMTERCSIALYCRNTQLQFPSAKQHQKSQG